MCHDGGAAYDAFGSLIETVGPRGNVAGADSSLFATTYDYDALNRRICETRPDLSLGGSGDRPVSEYHYDVGGRLTPVVLAGDVTPVLDGGPNGNGDAASISWFDGGADFPAGNYAIEYVGGELIYDL